MERLVTRSSGTPAETGGPIAARALADRTQRSHVDGRIVGNSRAWRSLSAETYWGAVAHGTGDARGITTSAVTEGTRTFAVELRFLDHQLFVRDATAAARGRRLPAQRADLLLPST